MESVSVPLRLLLCKSIPMMSVPLHVMPNHSERCASVSQPELFVQAGPRVATYTSWATARFCGVSQPCTNGRHAAHDKATIKYFESIACVFAWSDQGVESR